MSSKASWMSVDLGTKGMTVPTDVIKIQISSANLLGRYAKGFVSELYRVNENLAIREGLTEEEFLQYVHYLLYQRILCVRNECREYRRLKALFIPDYIQNALAMVGDYYDQENGYLFVVDCAPSTLTYDQAKAISDKVGCFASEVGIRHDAMPRDRWGDPDLMTTAIIADYVHSLREVKCVQHTYVSALLGLKLEDELRWKIIYRRAYDRVDFIENALFSYHEIYG